MSGLPATSQLGSSHVGQKETEREKRKKEREAPEVRCTSSPRLCDNHVIIDHSLLPLPLQSLPKPKEPKLERERRERKRERARRKQREKNKIGR